MFSLITQCLHNIGRGFSSEHKENAQFRDKQTTTKYRVPYHRLKS